MDIEKVYFKVVGMMIFRITLITWHESLNSVVYEQGKKGFNLKGVAKKSRRRTKNEYFGIIIQIN